MFKIATNTIDVLDDPEQAARLRTEFNKSAAIVLPAIFELQLLARVCLPLQNMAFKSHSISGVGQREIADQDQGFDQMSRILNFVLARPTLYRSIENLTGCAAIGGVEGTVARLSRGQYLDWHDDQNDKRRCLAITIGLSDARYEGGQFQLRHKNASEYLFSHLHKSPGEAVIFNINNRLEHRVTEVLSEEPRTVYAGWFLRAG